MTSGSLGSSVDPSRLALWGVSYSGVDQWVHALLECTSGCGYSNLDMWGVCVCELTGVGQWVHAHVG